MENVMFSREKLLNPWIVNIPIFKNELTEQSSYVHSMTTRILNNSLKESQSLNPEGNINGTQTQKPASVFICE